MNFNINEEWKNILKDEFQKSYFKNLCEHLKKEYWNYEIFPPKEEIFTALNLTPYSDVRVVIIGQDPYHGFGQAHGLAFSVKENIPLPPSLKNIFKEIKNENEGERFKHGNLSSWSKQGILLLNTSLTVKSGEANSHSKFGWSTFTDEIIKKINEKDKSVIFVLWGNNAKEKKKFITSENHIILEGVHPSPLSASRGFFGCNHFKKINELLKNRNEKIINWEIL